MMSIGKDIKLKCEKTMGIDFGVFQNTYTETKCESILECFSIQRIISGLLYYQTLTNHNNNHIHII